MISACTKIRQDHTKENNITNNKQCKTNYLISQNAVRSCTVLGGILG